MKITDRLKVEHGVFLQQLRYLGEMLAAGVPPALLAAVVETIASAEERHSEIEDKALYPLLTKALGENFPALVAVRGDHEAIRSAVARIRGGSFEAADVEAFAHLMRDHLEREIHSLFALAEEWLTEAQLTSMCNWNVEHVFDATGQREAWVRQWLG